MTNDPDLMLKALLATPERAPDEHFALHMERLVVAEEKLRAARAAAWTRFAVEMVATASLIVAFMLLSRLQAPAPDSAGIIPLYGPASAGLLLLALWVGVSLRPGGARSAR